MGYEPWQLSAMEESGYMDTNSSLIYRVAHILSESQGDVIGREKFRKACIISGVDPDSFTENDLVQIREILSRL